MVLVAMGVAPCALANESNLTVFVRLMIAASLVDGQEVLENSAQYKKVLKAISLNAQNKTLLPKFRESLIAGNLAELKWRAEAQEKALEKENNYLAWAFFVTQVKPEIKAVYHQAQVALASQRYGEILQHTKNASITLNEIILAAKNDSKGGL